SNNPATAYGNIISQESSVNTGHSGSQQTISNLLIGENNVAENVDLSIVFDSLETSIDFTIIKQEFEPNTYNGMDSLFIYSQKMWTVVPSKNSAFSADVTFDFGSQTFVDLNAENYKLYHRSIGDDGDWSLLVSQAAAISDSTIHFENVTQAGQFIIAK